MQKIILLIVLLVLPGLIIGCQDQQQNSQPEEESLEINLSQFMTTDATLLMIAEEKGFYDQVGLRVNKTACNVGKLCLDAVLAHKSDVATAVAINSATAVNQTSDQRIIAVVGSKNNRIIARVDKGIKTDQDLVDKKLGVLTAAKLDYFPSRYVDKHGGDASKINFVNLKPNEVATALIKGDIDAGFLWQPFAQDVINELGEKNVRVFQDDNLRQIITLTTTQEYVNDHPEELTRLVQALKLSYEWYQNNPDEAAQIVAKVLSRTPEEAKIYLADYDYRVRIDQQLEEQLMDQYMWLNERDGLTASELDKIRNIIDDRFMN